VRDSRFSLISREERDSSLASLKGPRPYRTPKLLVMVSKVACFQEMEILLKQLYRSIKEPIYNIPIEYQINEMIQSIPMPHFDKKSMEYQVQYKMA